jgi:hypothetical protein
MHLHIYIYIQTMKEYPHPNVIKLPTHIYNV